MRYYILVFLVAPLLLMSQQTDSTSVKKGRLALVAAGSASVLAGSYIYVQKSWWSDIATDFHFDDGSDLRYALNVDKGGHFFAKTLKEHNNNINYTKKNTLSKLNDNSSIFFSDNDLPLSKPKNK